MKKKFKKMISFVLLMIMVFQAISPSVVLAVSYQDGNEVTITGSTALNGDNLAYEHGSVSIKKNGNTVTTSTFSVAKDDQIVITLYADDGYEGKLGIDDYTVELNNGSYSFTIGQSTNSTISFNPSFVQEGSQNEEHVVTYDFILNGEVFEGFGNGDVLEVDDDFNISSVDELYIKNIYIDGTLAYTYDDNDYSYDLLDAEGRHILEVNFSETSENYVRMRIESHPDDIQKQNTDNYYAFYIPEINIVKEAFRGVEVTTSVMPDSYDFTRYNGVDLTVTSEDNPGNVTVYYGEDTFALLNDDIKKISLVENKGVPKNAIEINNDTHEVTVLSNYYNEIPLKVELNDGTIGYLTVNRIGIFIGSVNAGNDTFFHGAFADVGHNLANSDISKNRIAAVFYHENTRVYEDYKLIVNATYEDGRTETRVVSGIGDVPNSSGNITGSDFILWEGNNNMPIKVSVTAIDAEALSDEDNFGGVTFGSGEGVVWERD